MPSQAFRAFRYNLIDVDRLRQSHGLLSGGTQGRKGLGHITRSGVVMLCASWELYCEQVLRECAAWLSSGMASPLDLPLDVQKELSRAVKEAKHELKPLHLSGDGWRKVYCDHANDLTAMLNTPKSSKVNDLFHRILGIAKLSDAWAHGPEYLDKFVSVRGDIAHQGRHADYVSFVLLTEYRHNIRAYAVQTDNALAEHLRLAGRRARPWRATT